MPPLYGQSRSLVPIEPLPPEEEQSLLGQLSGPAFGTLGYLGGSLNKPGRFVRNIASGLTGGIFSARELLGLIPFSDTLGITDPNQEVTGSALLGNDPHPDLFSGEGAAGLATEIALDPLTYATFGAGALTKLGKLAQKAKVLPATTAERLAGVTGREAAELAAKATQLGTPTTVAQVAGQRLGGHLGLHVPFTNIGTTFDLGPLGRGLQNFGRALPGAGLVEDKLLNPLAQNVLNPVGRYLSAGFNPEVMMQTNEAGQAIGRRMYGPQQAGRVTGARSAAEVAELMGATELQADKQGLRHFVEKTGTPGVGAQAAGPKAEQALQAALAEKQYWGDRVDKMKDFFPRQVAEPELDLAKDFFAKYERSRQGILDMATDPLERMVADPVVGTSARTAADNLAAAQHLVQQHGVSARDAEALADFLYQLNPKRQQLGLFSKDAVQEYARYMESTGARVNMLKELYPILAEHAGSQMPGSTTVKELLGKLGLEPTASSSRAIDALQQAGKLPTNASAASLQNAIARMHVPQEIANALGAILKPDVRPDGPLMKVVKNLWDQATNLFKGGVTLPFPAFHMRNLVSSLGWQQTVLTGSARAALDGNVMMDHLAKGGVIKGISGWDIFKGWNKTDAELTRHVAQEMFARGVSGSGHVADVLGHSATDSIIQRLPGLQPAGFVDSLKSAGKKLIPDSGESLKPWAMRGIGGRPESQFFLARAGEEVARTIESTARGGGFLALLKQGYNFDIASDMVKAAHFDPAGMTKFESEFMRRLVPFYSFARRNIPYQLKQLLENPGGLTGQATRLLSKQGESGFTPEQVGQGAAVPLGAEQGGVQRYLSGLGLPFEEIGGQFTGRGILGMLNPIVKAPLEAWTGRSFFQGRDLRDLYSQTGNKAADFVIANSPASRLLSSYTTITDPRKSWGDKALNLGTGARLTDVNMDLARSSMLRNAIQGQLAGSPRVGMVERPYLRREEAQNLTPQELLLLRLQATLDQQARQRRQ